ncbi:hypothetical protein P879_03231 [Paragonimus westermani]|uniref:Uncharacterized protein n=1 Tax=Paragonimus westermani TaxID=34504 RepID=A0A8T0DLX6_9TREM|nr:hypothetical protein P879_03231 [Paragonimus westermani]
MGGRRERDNTGRGTSTENPHIMLDLEDVVECEPNAANEDAGKDGNLLSVDIRGDAFWVPGQPADLVKITMPGLRVRCSSGENFTGNTVDDTLAKYMRCDMSLTDLGEWQRLLGCYFPDLPNDPRALPRTPRSSGLQ